MSGFLISATRKSSGKTTIATALCSALHKRGINVQPFKKGPDYIDPIWLSLASKKSCRNLDFNVMSDSEIVSYYNHHASRADLSIIEGNKGLHDGMDIMGSNSNAAIAKLLDIPVILILNAKGSTRGLIPTIRGYIDFDKSINIIGVIFNNVGNKNQEKKLNQLMEFHLNIPIIGAIYQHEEMKLLERHLGLVPASEISNEADTKISNISNIIENEIDIVKLLELTNWQSHISKKYPQYKLLSSSKLKGKYHGLKIAIARDNAFNFYYQDDLDAFNELGVELVEINMLKDKSLPKIDGLFIGGGFPETSIEKLSQNQDLMIDVKSKIENGLPTYAECGGLMYLAKTISFNDKSAKMAGVINADIIMNKKPIGKGYNQLIEREGFPWPKILNNENNNTNKNPATIILAHEFHYSSLKDPLKSVQYAYDIKRGYGVDGKHDGIIYKNLLANYAHLRHTYSNPWIERFVKFVSQKSK